VVVEPAAGTGQINLLPANTAPGTDSAPNAWSCLYKSVAAYFLCTKAVIELGGNCWAGTQQFSKIGPRCCGDNNLLGFEKLEMQLDEQPNPKVRKSPCKSVKF